MSRALLSFSLFLVAAPVTAEPFLARESAQVGAKGDWSVGLLAPLQVAIADGLELRTHPVLFFVSPNLDLRKSHWVSGAWQVTGEYGLSVPTPLLRLTQGYLFPTTGKQIGWVLVPHGGAIVSRGEVDGHVLSISTDLAVGVPLSRHEVGPLGAPALLETELAPVLTGYRFQLGARYDRRLSERWRARGYADLFMHGANPSPLSFRAGAQVELRVGRMSRVSLGGVWWNSDQYAMDPRSLQRVRSNDFLPTFDFIWAG